MININAVADSFIIDNSDIWFIGKEGGILYCFDFEKKQLKHAIVTSSADIDKERLYHGIVKVDKYIIAFPCEADNICIYNIQNEKLSYISIPDKIIKRQYWHLPAKTLFWKIECINNIVYAAGMGFSGIIKLNIDDLSISVFDEWIDQIEGQLSEDNNEVYFEDFYNLNGILYLPFCCINAILVLDTTDDSYRIEYVECDNIGFSGIEYWNNQFILIPRKFEKLVFWNPDCKNTKYVEIEYEFSQEEMKKMVAPFESHIIISDKLFLFKVFSNKNYVINLDKLTVNDNTVDVFLNYYISPIYHFDCNNLKDMIIFINQDTSTWFIYDINDNTVCEQFLIKIPCEIKKIYIDSIKDTVMCENDNMNFNNYVELFA